MCTNVCTVDTYVSTIIIIIALIITVECINRTVYTWLKCHNKFDTKVKVQLTHSYTRTYFIQRIIKKKRYGTNE